jgi:hypothetical protein
MVRAVATNYGLSFFLPQIVKAFGLNTFLTTVVSATPYVVGVVGMVWWGRRFGSHGGAPVPHRLPAVRCSDRHRGLYGSR